MVPPPISVGRAVAQRHVDPRERFGHAHGHDRRRVPARLSHRDDLLGDDAPSAITTLTLSPGLLAFSATYRYLNNPLALPPGTFPIVVTVTNSHAPARIGVDRGDGVQRRADGRDPDPRAAQARLLVSLFAAVTDPGTLDSHTYQWSVNGTPVPSATRPASRSTPRTSRRPPGASTSSAVTCHRRRRCDRRRRPRSAPGRPFDLGPHDRAPAEPGQAQVAETVDYADRRHVHARRRGLVFYTASASNRVTIDPGLTLPAVLVSTPGGSNTLVGGSGDDTLFSARGMDTLIGTTGPTTFVLVLSGQDPVLQGSTGINTIDLSQTPQDITLNLGLTTPQLVDGGERRHPARLRHVPEGNRRAGKRHPVRCERRLDDPRRRCRQLPRSSPAATGDSSIVGGTRQHAPWSAAAATRSSTAAASGDTSVVGGSGNATVVGGGGNSIIYGSDDRQTRPSSAARATRRSSAAAATPSSTAARRATRRSWAGRATRRWSAAAATPSSTAAPDGNDLGRRRHGQHDGRGRRRQLDHLRQHRRNDLGRRRHGQHDGRRRRRQLHHLRQHRQAAAPRSSAARATPRWSAAAATPSSTAARRTTTRSSAARAIPRWSAAAATRSSTAAGSATPRSSAASGNTTVVGGGGNSIIYGGTTATTSVVGGTGNTTVVGGGGNSIIYGGTTATPRSSAARATRRWSAAAATRSSTAAPTATTSVVGGSGNTTVVGGGGNSIIYGSTGGGGTSVVGGSGNTTVVGGGGNSIIYGSTGGDTSVVGGSGNTTVIGGGGNSIIYGGTGTRRTPRVVGGSGKPRWSAAAATPSSTAAPAGNTSVVGGIGQHDGRRRRRQLHHLRQPGGDHLGRRRHRQHHGRRRRRQLDHLRQYGSGDTSVVGGSGNTTVVGGGGNSIIYGSTDGNVSLVGGSGNATIVGGGGNSIIYGGTGNDSLVAGSGPATLRGGGGTDVITGRPEELAGRDDPVRTDGTPETVTLTDTSFVVPGYETETISGISQFAVTLGSGQFVLDASQTTLHRCPDRRDGELHDPRRARATTRSSSARAPRPWSAGRDTTPTSSARMRRAAVTINNASDAADTLDFSQFSRRHRARSRERRAPGREPGALDPDDHEPVGREPGSGTAYPDTILGNGRGDTLIGNGGADYLDGRGGGALIQGAATQVVLPRTSTPGAVDYSSQAIRDAIQARLTAIYGAFNYTFTQTIPASGPYAELELQRPGRVLSRRRGDRTRLEEPEPRRLGHGRHQPVPAIPRHELVGVAGLPEATTQNIINMSATIAAHELGHLSGLLHEDAFGADRLGRLG